jgi:hypothetical protein
MPCLRRSSHGALLGVFREVRIGLKDISKGYDRGELRRSKQSFVTGQDVWTPGPVSVSSTSAMVPARQPLVQIACVHLGVVDVVWCAVAYFVNGLCASTFDVLNQSVQSTLCSCRSQLSQSYTSRGQMGQLSHGQRYIIKKIIKYLCVMDYERPYIVRERS